MEIVKAFVKAFSFYFLRNTRKRKNHKQIVITYIHAYTVYVYIHYPGTNMNKFLRIWYNLDILMMRHFFNVISSF